MKLFKKLRVRLAVVCAASTGLVLIGMAAASYHFSAKQLRIQADESFSSNLNAVFFYLRGQPVVNHTWLSRTEASSGLWIRIESRENRLMFNEQQPVRNELTALALQTAQAEHGFDLLGRPSDALQPDTVFFLLSTGYGSYRAAVSHVPMGDGWLIVTILKNTAPEQAQINRLRLIFFVCVCLAMLCLLVFTWLFTAWATRPIEENRRRQTEFVSAASHEFRSPLAVMQVSAENIRQAPPDVAEHFVDMIVRECDRLSRLTDDMLRLAGADNQSWSMTLAPVNPEALVLSAFENSEQLARQKRISLQTGLPSEALPKITCDAQRIEQVLAILLDNALQHTPEDGKILITAYSGKRNLYFMVSDSGPGIPDNQREQVFKRFFRGDASRSDKEHYGLGLSIAREIALLHKGALTVGDSGLGGAEFILKIPIRDN